MIRRAAISLALLLGLSMAVSATQHKGALVIGNGAYSNYPDLTKPVPEARQLEAVLTSMGFEVELLANADREQMFAAIFEFEERTRSAGGVALFHFGGHGVQAAGENYLIPIDADIDDERQIDVQCVSVKQIMSSLERANPEASIIILDACRDNPLEGTAGRTLARGLAPLSSRLPNSIIVFAAQPDQVAIDGLFTPTLVDLIATPGAEITDILRDVRARVVAESGQQQCPESVDRLVRDVILVPATSAVIVGPPPITLTPSVGTLSILTEVSGSLFIDGSFVAELAARDDFELGDVAAGERLIVLEYQGGAIEQVVTVVKDQVKRLTLRPTIAPRVTNSQLTVPRFSIRMDYNLSIGEGGYLFVPMLGLSWDRLFVGAFVAPRALIDAAASAFGLHSPGFSFSVLGARYRLFALGESVSVVLSSSVRLYSNSCLYENLGVQAELVLDNLPVSLSAGFAVGLYQHTDSSTTSGARFTLVLSAGLRL